jgi:hypothetical protein
MDREKVLWIVSEHGEEAGSDYNDSDHVMGYFGWSIKDGILTATYEPENNSDEPDPFSYKWKLTPIDD